MRSSVRLHIAVVILVSLPLCWLFAGSVIDGRVFLFRDAAHFYYPLLQWTSQRWSEGEVPLWNPHENCGWPVLADTTSAVFYPGKLLFALPGLDFSQRYSLLIFAHVALAAAAAYLTAHKFGSSAIASGICAVAYSLSGSVLFQYCNLPFLIGAAWLPLAVLAAHTMLVSRPFFGAVSLSVVLAMMTLGGDPQSAYNAGLIGALLVLVLAMVARSDQSPSAQDPPQMGRAGGTDRSASPPTPPGFWKHLGLLLAAGAGAAILAGVQLLPAIEWSARSDRTWFEAPRSVYEIPNYLRRDSTGDDAWQTIRNGLFGQPRRGTHQEHIYGFSVEPWRLPEFWWPNFSGRIFPENRRWTQVIPASGRTWTPSLYIGLLPILLAIGQFRLRGGSASDRWLTLVAILFALASLGWYGVGWMLQEFQAGLGKKASPWLGQPVGGLYWLMVNVLPGYVYFRFPAKLMVAATLALSLLAARGWDRLRSDGVSRRLLQTIAGLGLLSLLLAVVVQCVPSRQWGSWLSTAPVDDAFGPLNIKGSVIDLRNSLLHTGLLCMVLWCLLGVSQRRRWLYGTAVPAAALLVTCLDLTVAHNWTITSAPHQLFTTGSSLVQQIHKDWTNEVCEPRVYRGSMQRWVPQAWKQVRSPDRQFEILAWDRSTLFPKYQLLAHSSLVEAYSTMNERNYAAMLQTAKQLGPRREDGVGEPHIQLLSALSASYFILPDNVSYAADGSQRVSGTSVENAVLWYNPAHLKRTWIVHQVDRLRPLGRVGPREVFRRAHQVLLPDGKVPRDFSRSAVIESDSTIAPFPLAANSQQSEEYARITAQDATQVVIDARLGSPGIVVLSDLYYPGWRATVHSERSGSSRQVEILRTNRVMRGIELPAGRHKIVYEYKPTSFRNGVLLSLAGWLVLIAVTGRRLLKPVLR